MLPILKVEPVSKCTVCVSSDRGRVEEAKYLPFAGGAAAMEFREKCPITVQALGLVRSGACGCLTGCPWWMLSLRFPLMDVFLSLHGRGPRKWSLCQFA